jgi:cyclopropane-fatty-acyl-phospholipid synthase
MRASARRSGLPGGQHGCGVSADLAARIARQLAERCKELPVGFELVLPGGDTHPLGTGPASFRILIRDRRGLMALASLSETRVSEEYFNGSIDVEGDMLAALSLRSVLVDRNALLVARNAVQAWLSDQTRINRRAIRHHYERDQDFFLQFLDKEMPIYTHGVFERDDESLAMATLRKFQLCFDGCNLQAGKRILEVGPGWGAWLKFASDRGVHCTAISISEESIAYVKSVGRTHGYDWDVSLCDLLNYSPQVPYDAVILMGVIEHLPNYRSVLRKLASLVTPGSRIYIDGGASRADSKQSSMIKRHIYPGNHALMSLDKLVAEIMRSPLRIHSVFNDRHSYYLTFRQWAQTLERRREYISTRFGEREFRQFQLFLWGFAQSMQSGALDCYRVVMERP